MNFAALRQKSPYLYFILVGCSIAIPNIIGGLPSSSIVLILCLPFVYQIFRESKDLNILLGILMMMWSLYMLLAFLSDAFRIQNPYSTYAILFLTVGGIFAVLNFRMSAQLFKLAVHKSSDTDHSSVPA